MSNRPLRFALLLTVVILAVALALTTARGAGAGSLFQSSPPLPPEEPTKVAEPTQLLPEEIPPEVPIIEPGAFPTNTPESAPVAPGFLPAPTLTNPDDLAAGGALSQSGQAPLSGAAAPVAEPEPTAEPDPPGAAALIDSIIIAFGYVWLICGAGLLVLAALVFVWLMRRSAARRRPRI